MADYAEHEKLRKVRRQSEEVAAFLEWLLYVKQWRITETQVFYEWEVPWHSSILEGPPTPRGLTNYRFVAHSPRHGPGLVADTRDRYGFYRRREIDGQPPGGIQEWLAEYFEIDLQRLAEEKDKMLADIRVLNEARKTST